MKTLVELNSSIDGTKYLPYNLPIYEYILMPQVGSEDFDNFWRRYIQSNGENLNDFDAKLSPNPIYAVFKNDNKPQAFLFKAINEIKPIKL